MTQAFRDRYRRRPLVERCIAELAMHGIHQARYVGSRKLTLQAAFTALVVNINRAARSGALPKVAPQRDNHAQDRPSRAERYQKTGK